MAVWSGRGHIVSELNRVQHMVGCMALSAFPGTATVVMEALLCLPPLTSVIRGRAVAAMHRLRVWDRWTDFELDGIFKRLGILFR